MGELSGHLDAHRQLLSHGGENRHQQIIAGIEFRLNECAEKRGGKKQVRQLNKFGHANRQMRSSLSSSPDFDAPSPRYPLNHRTRNHAFHRIRYSVRMDQRTDRLSHRDAWTHPKTSFRKGFDDDKN